ncbi:hypothetical protein B1H58_04595 [Pantoea alhagi]|uniref:YtfJ family protein n=1 Tax=Pantoea alhagi TaxID=1891675 RepID=A0A1W6B2R4_9GAMM|nr:YtfJ family protein [Pantoea alhagi]ARJ41359.1 hypothetical protein B1H58_04595 [Pantoea alhagi]
MTPRLPVLLLCALPFFTSAHNFIDGARLAPVGVTDRGELVLQQGEPAWQNWNSAQLSGKVGVVLHMAGRLSAKERNAAVIGAIENARFPAEKFQITTIVNTDDAIPGSAMFVRRSLESSKQETPTVQFVVDEQGAVRRAWQLTEGDSAVIVLDKQGRVRFAKDGALTQSEVQQVIALLQQLLT